MKIKRVIEIEENDLALMKKTTLVEDPNTMLHQTAEDRAKTLMMLRFADAIKDSKPYDDSGDLISREALKKAIEQGEGISWDKNGKDDLCVRKKYIDNAPAVDISENEYFPYRTAYFNGVEDGKATARPKGEWIMFKNSDGNLKCYECSECGNGHGYKADFCEKCGADMRGGAE